MTPVVLHVVHGRPVVMKESMFSMVKCIVGLMGGSDIVLRLRMLRSLLVMPCGGFVMLGCDKMKRPSGQIRRGRNGG